MIKRAYSSKPFLFDCFIITRRQGKLKQLVHTLSLKATAMIFSVKNALVFSGIALLLSACASDFVFKSNLDGKAINEYFKVGDVVLYDGEVQPKGNFEVLGLVEGEDCQETAKDTPPQMAEARTNARRAAAELGANGFVVKSCFMITEADNSCFSRALCVGQAIKTADVK